MRRKRHAWFGTVIALASAAAYACSDEYTDAPPAPGGDDAGTDAATDRGPVILEPANPPGISLGKIAVARGETTKAKFVVTRGVHGLPLDIVASGLPAGLTVAPVKVPIDTTAGEIEVSAAVTAREGSTTIELALLEENTKLATASVIVEVGALRAGSLDPEFGKNGVVDLDLPRSLIAFGEDGTLYVNATSGLARWNKDGTRDATYGPMTANPLPASFQPIVMVASNSAQVHFAGYRLESGGAKATIFRVAGDGRGYDATFGQLGAATVATPPSAPSSLFSAYGLGVTPTGLYAIVRLQKDGATMTPGGTTIGRLSLAGETDTAYGTGGYLTLPIDPSSPELAFFESVGVDHFLVAVTDRLSGAPFLRLFEGTADKKLTTRLGDYGAPRAVAWDPTTSTSLLAREADAGVAVVRVGDAGALPNGINAGDASVNAITIDTAGRPLLTGCQAGKSSWKRYLPDGGADATYRSGETPEMSCVLAARTTEKFVYLAGVGGTPEKLRLARLVR